MLTARRLAVTRRHGAATNGGLTLLAGVDINTAETALEGAEGKTDFKRAKSTKITLVRNNGELKESGAKAPGYTLAELCKFASEEGLTYSYISYQGMKAVAGVTTAGKEGLEKFYERGESLVKQLETLTGPELAALALIELGNENWPATGAGWQEGQQTTGAGYAKWFIEQAKKVKEAGFTVPVGMQVNTSKEAGAEKWMKEIIEYGEAHPVEFKEALIGTGTEAKPNNRLASHVYGGLMTTKMETPNSLYSFKGALGEEYCAQRWMCQQALIKEKFGLIVPMAITEYGGNTEGETAKVKAEKIVAWWEFMKLVQKGEVPGADIPSVAGYAPVVAAAVWYAVYQKTGAETYGVLKVNTETPEETEEWFKKFKTGVEAL